MEAFSLLKYWRGGGGVFARDSTTASIRTVDSSSSTATTTIVTAVSSSSSGSDVDDDGPFFDLEFALPDDSDTEDQMKGEENVTVAAASVEDLSNESNLEDTPKGQCQMEPVADVLSDNEFNEGDEIKFALSSSSSADFADPNIALSPSDDLFFKGRLVPIESSSLSLNPSEAIPKFPVSSILKSATKFRVLMLKLNKSKSNVREKSAKSEATVSPPKSVDKNQQEKDGQERKQQSKFFTVKFKVEEVPIVSLFTRENSSKGNASKANTRDNNNDVENSNTRSSSNGAPDDKKFSKEVMQKYLKKVKPSYIRVSKRYGEKLKLSGQLNLSKSGAGPSPPPEVKSPPAKSTAIKAGEAAEVGALNTVKSQKQGNLQAGLRVVCKHLGKSRSASSAAVATAPSATSSSSRRDDSLLQQQDGIQGAILHCKRSFNASRELEASILSRSVSDSSHGQCDNLSVEDSSSTSEEAKTKAKPEGPEFEDP